MTKKAKKTKEEPILSKPLGVVFGHKIEDMKVSIAKFEEEGLEPFIVTWPRYETSFEGYTTHIQKTPENQGMDCINLVHHSADFLFKLLKAYYSDRVIGKIANHHTKPTIWEWDLTNEQWEDLFDFNPNQKVKVDEVVQSLRKLNYLTKEEAGIDAGFEY